MMMMMTIRKHLLLLILLFAPVIAFSQKKDFGIWYSISGEHKLASKLKLDLTADLRTFSNASKIKQGYFDAGLSYKINKLITAGGGYRFIYYYEDDDSFHPRHRWYAEAKAGIPVGDFELSARFRFQETFRTYFKNENDKIPDNHGRIKLNVYYNIPSFPVNPYIAAEFYFPMFTETTRYIDRNRFIAGLEWNISKKNSIDLEFLRQRSFLPKIKDLSVLSISYSFKF